MGRVQHIPFVDTSMHLSAIPGMLHATELRTLDGAYTLRTAAEELVVGAGGRLSMTVFAATHGGDETIDDYRSLSFRLTAYPLESPGDSGVWLELDARILSGLPDSVAQSPLGWALLRLNARENSDLLTFSAIEARVESTRVVYDVLQIARQRIGNANQLAEVLRVYIEAIERRVSSSTVEDLFAFAEADSRDESSDD